MTTKKTEAGSLSSRHKKPISEQPSDNEAKQTTSLDRSDASPRATGFPIVGIGASAGGLEAVEGFFRHMAVDCGIAFVLVQHLDPHHKSILSELLGRKTQIPVQEAVHGQRVAANHIYVIPPNQDLSLLHGVLQLIEVSTPRHLRLSIDYFFRSLAQDQGERAVGIVLSGTGTDGTLGVRAIKGEGGLVMVQDPASAAYDGMPRSAIATGLADAVLPPDEMARQLQAYARHAHLPDTNAIAGEPPIPTGDRDRLFVLVRNQTGYDFSLYKEATIGRRILRRMALHQIQTEKDYVRYLQQSPAEVDALWREFLIPVTQFFRNPKVFELIARRVIPEILQDRAANEPVRIWAPACSTGEEAYSLAILMREHMHLHKQERNIQIFATDIDEESLKTARTGVYPESIVSDVSQERLRRYFFKEGDRFVAGKTLRSMLVFSTHNIVKDPPFSRMDFVSCRNLLIYMKAELQTRVLALAHYALNPDGYLLLGDAETLGGAKDLFEEIDKKCRLYRRCDVELSNTLKPAYAGLTTGPDLYGIGRRATSRRNKIRTLGEVTEKILLENYAPTCIVVDRNGQMLYVHGNTGDYLEAVTGEASLNIVHLAREDLRLPLGAALREAAAESCEIRYTDLPLQVGSERRHVTLTVRSFPAAAPPGAMMVLLEGSLPAMSMTADTRFNIEGKETERIATLEQELTSTREVLQTANEELQTSNEELGSTVEELQSTNQELLTSQEELRSINEELLTVNAELENKVEELDSEKNDMVNLLSSTEIGTVFLDLELSVKRFTPAMTKVIHLIKQDIGRPLAHIAHNLYYTNMIEDIEAVLDSLNPLHTEVKDRSGNWYALGITLYRTATHAIEGVVLTFVDITERKRAEEQLRALVENAPDATIISNQSGKIVLINSRAETLLEYKREELIGREIEILVPGLQEERHREHRARFLQNPQPRPMASGLDLLALTKSGRELQVEISLAPLQTRTGLLVSSSIREVTEQRRAQQVLRRNNGIYQAFCHWSRALLHTSDPDADLNELCRMLVEGGGYLRCWINLCVSGKDNSQIRFGYPKTDTKALESSWPVLDTNEKTVVLRDILTNPAHVAQRQQALQWGCASAVSLPLYAGESRVGRLIIHASEPDAFDTSEVKLLMTLCETLSQWCIHRSGYPLCGE